ncbi:MAG: TIGR04283 family arsenosugar biosynthesis glycosyltransferase [Pseudomonadota bacterium]|nr:TIGR04283 family arsenosugar biosynthesis glycosyltransferase [Pseudomonadota bacterium]
MISVVIPTLDEAAALPALLGSLGGVDEVIVVDGGSRDDTVEIAARAGATVVTAPRGRGSQLAAGTAAARGDLLWFLHADTGVPVGAAAALRATRAAWGCFEVTIASEDPRLRLVAAAMNLRARRTGSATGDMGIWARRPLLAKVGGWVPLLAFEDLVFTDRARRLAPAEVLAPAVTTSARRWNAHGLTRTVLTMLALRAAYRLGADPALLAELYRGEPR